jgi:prepilin-type processing-associated H-X9-DG protein
MMYIQDYDNRLMGATPNSTSSEGNNWELVESYIKNTQLLFCPSAPTYKGSPFPSYQATNYGFPVDWTGNGHRRSVVERLTVPGVFYSNFNSPPLLDSIPEASRTCLIGEAKTDSNGRGHPLIDVISNNSAIGLIQEDRHLEGANYAYLDGHVKWLSRSAVDAVIEAGKGKCYSGTDYTCMDRAKASNYPIVFVWGGF